MTRTENANEKWMKRHTRTWGGWGIGWLNCFASNRQTMMLNCSSVFYAQDCLWDFAAFCPSLGHSYVIVARDRESHRLHWRHQWPKPTHWEWVFWQSSQEEFSGSLRALSNLYRKENPDIFTYIISIIHIYSASPPFSDINTESHHMQPSTFDKVIIYATPCCRTKHCCRTPGCFGWVGKVQYIAIPARDSKSYYLKSLVTDNVQNDRRAN